MAEFATVAANVGLQRLTSLIMWAESASKALGGEVHLYGSALRSKEWRDLDVGFDWCPPNRQGDLTWRFLSAALSAHASAVVGAEVEVHLYAWNGQERGDRLVLTTDTKGS